MEMLDANSNGRFILWRAGIEIWQARPLFGSTLRNFRAYGHDIVEGWASFESSLHNGYLNLLVSSGLLGTVSMFAFLIFLVFVSVSWVVRPNPESGFSTGIFVSLFAGLAIYAFPTTALFMAHNIATMAFWVFMSYFLALNLPSEAIFKLFPRRD
jgi:O-antigen ligase